MPLSADLATVKQIGKATDDPATTVVCSLVPVPVSVRGHDAQGVPDNRVSALLLDLPVDIDDPRERLDAVRCRMGDLKGSHMAEAGLVATEVGNLAPLATRARREATLLVLPSSPYL